LVESVETHGSKTEGSGLFGELDSTPKSDAVLGLTDELGYDGVE
jgi:hypothetical protein